MCEGVGHDSGYGHEKSHLIHDMNIPCKIAFSVWNVVCCVCVIACAFRLRVALIGEFLYSALLTPLWDPLLGVGSEQGERAPTRP